MQQCSMRSGLAAVWILAATLPAGAEQWLQRWVETQEALFLRETFDELSAGLELPPVQAAADAAQADEAEVAAADATASIGPVRTGANDRIRATAKPRSPGARGYQRCTGYSWCTTSCRKAAKGSRQAAWCERNGARTSG